jgi:hypothetical protein
LFSVGTLALPVLVPQNVFERFDQLRPLRIEFQQMNARQPVKKLPAARCNPKAYTTSILRVLCAFEQTFPLAAIHQFHSTVVFQPQGVCSVGNRGRTACWRAGHGEKKLVLLRLHPGLERRVFTDQ